MWHNIPQIRAKLLFKRRYVYENGDVLEMKAWSVPKTPRMPEGFKYSMVYVNAHGIRLLGYDNGEGKGHHRHEGKMEQPFEFENIEKLVERFLKEAALLSGASYES